MKTCIMKIKFPFYSRSLFAPERGTVMNFLSRLPRILHTYTSLRVCVFMWTSACEFIHPNTYKTNYKAYAFMHVHSVNL